jgi:hypothetical protein
MNVYVVMLEDRSFTFDSVILIGVYATKEAAQRCIDCVEMQDNREEIDDKHYTITEVPLQGRIPSLMN